MILRPEPLTATAFAPFGAVIETAGRASFPINDGMTDRFDALAMVETDAAGQGALSIFRSRRWPEMRLTMMERHPDGSQAFVPLSPHDWLVVVGAEPRADALRCFLARGDQGVQYGRGVWHHPLLVLELEQDFLIVDRKGPGENLEIATLDPAARIEL